MTWIKTYRNLHDYSQKKNHDLDTDFQEFRQKTNDLDRILYELLSMSQENTRFEQDFIRSYIIYYWGATYMDRYV